MECIATPRALEAQKSGDAYAKNIRLGDIAFLAHEILMEEEILAKDWKKEYKQYQKIS